jgi:hypothetical protein
VKRPSGSVLVRASSTCCVRERGSDTLCSRRVLITRTTWAGTGAPPVSVTTPWMVMVGASAPSAAIAHPAARTAAARHATHPDRLPTVFLVTGITGSS